MIEFHCDGCGALLPRHAPHAADDRQDPATCGGCRHGHEGTVVGRLDPAHYCAGCAVRWAAHEAAVTARRRQTVRDFEAWLRETEQALTRTTLRRLPDA